jgi:hypothetical protein
MRFAVVMGLGESKDANPAISRKAIIKPLFSILIYLEIHRETAFVTISAYSLLFFPFCF